MTSAPIMTSPRSVSQPIRTLVVDDSVVVRTVIERILNADPHYCVVNKSSSAEQALAFLADNKVDLVLLDIEVGETATRHMSTVNLGSLGSESLFDAQSRNLLFNTGCRGEATIGARYTHHWAGDHDLWLASGNIDD